MKRSTFLARALTVVAVLAACGDRDPSGRMLAPPDPMLAKGPPAPAPYTTTDLGTLLGNTHSEARGVNDAGSVVGITGMGPDVRAFAIVGGAQVTLGGTGVTFASAISNGSPAFVVGTANTQPVRWSLGDPGNPVALQGGGAPLDVNDAGASVGYAVSDAVMWAPDGTRTTIPRPAGMTRGEARGINNSGDVALRFFTSGSDQAGSRAYVRLAAGTLVELPPSGSDVLTLAHGISEVVNGQFFVAGATGTNIDNLRAVRWTIRASDGQILSTQVRSDASNGWAVSDAGAVAGLGGGKGGQGAMLWRPPDLLKLTGGKGGSDPWAWTVSRNGSKVAGYLYVRAQRHAVVWSIAAP